MKLEDVRQGDVFCTRQFGICMAVSGKTIEDPLEITMLGSGMFVTLPSDIEVAVVPAADVESLFECWKRINKIRL